MHCLELSLSHSTTYEVVIAHPPISPTLATPVLEYFPVLNLFIKPTVLARELAYSTFGGLYEGIPREEWLTASLSACSSPTGKRGESTA